MQSLAVKICSPFHSIQHKPGPRQHHFHFLPLILPLLFLFIPRGSYDFSLGWLCFCFPLPCVYGSCTVHCAGSIVWPCLSFSRFFKPAARPNRSEPVIITTPHTREVKTRSLALIRIYNLSLLSFTDCECERKEARALFLLCFALWWWPLYFTVSFSFSDRNRKFVSALPLLHNTRLNRLDESGMAWL